MFGVMGDSGTAMRDPFFYRWHAFIDSIFQKFKASPASPAYTRVQVFFLCNINFYFIFMS